MTSLVSRVTGDRRLGLAIGVLVGLFAAAVTFADPRTGGLMLVIGVAALVVGVLSLRSAPLAMLLLVCVSYGRELVKGVPGDALLLAVYGVLISTAFAVNRGEHRLPRLGIPELLMMLYVLWNVGSMILPHDLPGGEGIWKFVVKGSVIPFVAYLIGRIVFDSEQWITRLLWLVAGLSTYSTFNAIVQIHGPKSLVFPKVSISETGWVNRAVGVFNQPVVNGVMLAIGFVVLFYLASETSRRWLKVALYASAAGAVYAIQLTQTRSALASLIAIIVLGALFAKGWRKPFVVTLCIGAVGALANIRSLLSSNREAGGLGSSYELIDRLNIAATALRAMNEHPWLGVGIDRFRGFNTASHVAWSPSMPWANGHGNVAHETELGIGAELGIPGLALWLSVVVCVVVALIRALRGLPDGRPFGAKFAFLGLCSLVVWELNALFVDMRLLDFANVLPWLLMGVAVGLHERMERRTAEGPPPSLGPPGPHRPGGPVPGSPVPGSPVPGGPPPGPTPPHPAPGRAPEWVS